VFIADNCLDSSITDYSVNEKKLEYLLVYGRASMGVPVGELHYGRTSGTVLYGHVRP